MCLVYKLYPKRVSNIFYLDQDYIFWEVIMTDLRKTVAIVGVDESDEIGKVPGKSNLQHHAEAAHNALADAGMSLKDVNGLFALGIQLWGP